MLVSAQRVLVPSGERPATAMQPDYTLGMVGPVAVEEFRPFLDARTCPTPLPKGLGGSPVNLLCLELLRRGRRLTIFTTDPGIRQEVVVNGDRLKLCIVPQLPHTGRRFFRSEIEVLARAIAREQPDVLHAQWTYEFALAALAVDIPQVVTAHDAPFNVLRHNFIPFRLVRTFMALRVLRKARRVVAVSPYVVQHFRKYRLYSDAVDVIPNGLSTGLFERDRRHVLSSTQPTFATILMGWAGMKNGQVAIDAFAKVRAVIPAARLVMFGAGHGAGEGAHAYAKARGIADGIEFVGQIEYAVLQERLAREVDVLVHPSLEESHGMVLIEAMAVGIPTIGGESAGAVPWTLDGGRAGRLVDVRRSDLLADAMLALARDPEAARALGARGRDFALGHFHIRSVADAYERIYGSLLRERA